MSKSLINFPVGLESNKIIHGFLINYRSIFKLEIKKYHDNYCHTKVLRVSLPYQGIRNRIPVVSVLQATKKGRNVWFISVESVSKMKRFLYHRFNGLIYSIRGNCSNRFSLKLPFNTHSWLCNELEPPDALLYMVLSFLNYPWEQSGHLTLTFSWLNLNTIVNIVNLNRMV